jgi:REP element-mobilizing transposase RayT
MSEKYIFHITCVTHNTRISERMKSYRIKPGFAISLSEKEEVLLTKIITSIVTKSKLKILAYNICKDHIHFAIYCEEERLNRIVQNLKSVSSRKFQQRTKIPHLWAQKFNRKVIDIERQLDDVINYIQMNRYKHNLSENKELKSIINKMITPIETIESCEEQVSRGL